ncbi:VTT domain-containing protein [bacterium]|nr:VTT domain-containing protein [candidate division CSSED10-310 bacterium]
MEAAQQFLVEFGIWALAAGAFFEGYLFVIGAGMLVSQSLLSPLDAFLAAAFGAWTGHIFWYYLGRYLDGRRFMNLLPGWRWNHKFINDMIHQKPWTSIFLLQYVFGVRLVGAIEFGLTKIPIGWFAVAQMVNCMIWSALLMLLGYSFGELIEHPGMNAAKYLWILGSIVCLLIAVHCYLRAGSESNIPDRP